MYCCCRCTCAILAKLGVEIWWRRRSGGPQKSILPKKLFLDGVECSQPFRKKYTRNISKLVFFELHFPILASLLAGAVVLGFGYQLTGTGWFERHSVDSEWPGWGGLGRIRKSASRGGPASRGSEDDSGAGFEDRNLRGLMQQCLLSCGCY